MATAGTDPPTGAIPLILKLKASGALFVAEKRPVTGSDGCGRPAAGLLRPRRHHLSWQRARVRRDRTCARSRWRRPLPEPSWAGLTRAASDQESSSAMGQVGIDAAQMAAPRAAVVVGVKPTATAPSLEAAASACQTREINTRTAAARLGRGMPRTCDGRRAAAFPACAANDGRGQTAREAASRPKTARTAASSPAPSSFARPREEPRRPGRDR